MLKIWILILLGIILVPLISTALRELEERLEKVNTDQNIDVKNNKIKNRDDLEFAIKFLKYAVIILFIIITIIMIRFTTQIISSK